MQETDLILKEHCMIQTLSRKCLEVVCWQNQLNTQGQK